MLLLIGDRLACKEDVLGSLHTSLRNRDTILSQRQAEITAKEAQVKKMEKNGKKPDTIHSQR
jgi:uncharacterized protein (DUF3084 family)